MPARCKTAVVLLLNPRWSGLSSVSAAKVPGVDYCFAAAMDKPFFMPTELCRAVLAGAGLGADAGGIQGKLSTHPFLLPEQTVFALLTHVHSIEDLS